MMHRTSRTISIIFCFLMYFMPLCFASKGDYSNEYRGCYHTCHFNNCTSEKQIYEFKKRQSLPEKFLLWSCDDECKYHCMWHATTIYMEKGWVIPQFHGKWPFKRIYGMQEPASVVFSFLNFISHCFNIIQFRKRVTANAPLYTLWHLYFAICLNAWIWSVVFHAKDTELSEKMDYFSAFSMVVFSFFILLIRITGKENHKVKILFGTALLLFFIYHIWYLSSRAFDYGYNMKVNVVVGLVNGLGWLVWSWSRSDTRPYLFWCKVTILFAGASMVLELLDFAPFFWIFDAHALWHLSTSILPFYWYRFIEGDCLYLLDKTSHQSALKKTV